MEHRAKRHRVDGQEAIVSEKEHDHLEEVAGQIGSDGKLPRRVGIGIEVDDHNRVIGRMADRMVPNSVSSSRPMDLHTSLAYYTTLVENSGMARRSTASEAAAMRGGMVAICGTWANGSWNATCALTSH